MAWNGKFSANQKRETLKSKVSVKLMQVEEKISLLLAEKKFAILIDGWSKGSTHYRELQLFLKVNKRLWGKKTVQNAMNIE